MDDKGQDKVIAFDTLFTNKNIQMLKILMPYFDLPMQKNLAIYIKFQELQYTMTFFQKYPTASLSPLPKETTFDILKLCGEIMPYCEPSQRAKMENMQNMFQTMQNYKEMMETVQMMKDLFPEGENPMDSDFLSGLTGMTGGFDPSSMFEMFQAMSGQSEEPTTGGDTNGTESEPSEMDGG